jgi:hypothetical protein
VILTSRGHLAISGKFLVLLGWGQVWVQREHLMDKNWVILNLQYPEEPTPFTHAKFQPELSENIFILSSDNL